MDNHRAPHIPSTHVSNTTQDTLPQCEVQWHNRPLPQNASYPLTIAITVLIAVSLITWLIQHWPDYLQHALNQALEAQDIHIEQIGHPRLRYRQLTLHDVTLHTQTPVAAVITLSQLHLQWAIRPTSLRHWITGLQADDVRISLTLNTQSHNTQSRAERANPLQTLNALQTLMTNTQQFPWSIALSGQLDSASPEQPSWSFSLNQHGGDARKTHLLTWSSSAQQLMALSYPSNDADLPYHVKWETPYSTLNARWQSPTAEQTLHQQARSSITPSWEIRGSLQLKTPATTPDATPPFIFQDISPDRLHVDTLEIKHFHLHLPKHFDPLKWQNWFRFAEGGGEVTARALTLRVNPEAPNTPNKHTLFHLSGTAKLTLQPGNWVAELTTPTQIHSEVSAVAFQDRSATGSPIISANTWLQALLLPHGHAKIDAELPPRTQLTLSSDWHFQLRAEDVTTFTVDTNTYSAQGTLSALIYQHGESIQTEALLNMTWDIPPHPPLTFLTQANIVLSDTLWQMDLNGNTPDASKQWDIHMGFDATTAQGHFDRQLVLDGQAASTRTELAHFANLLPPPPRNSTRQTGTAQQAPAGFSRSIITTRADIHLQNDQSGLDLLALNPRPSALLTEPALFIPADTLHASRRSSPLLDLQTQIQWHALSLNHLLSALSLNHCTGDGVGLGTLELTWPSRFFAFPSTPKPSTPKYVFRYSQEQPTTLRCSALPHRGTPDLYAYSGKIPSNNQPLTQAQLRYALQKERLPALKNTPIKSIDIRYPLTVLQPPQQATEIRLHTDDAGLLPLWVLQAPDLKRILQ
ncbi:MAG: hypothetical protein P8176_00975 [Gammaproteobacteria bacterium]